MLFILKIDDLITTDTTEQVQVVNVMYLGTILSEITLQLKAHIPKITTKIEGPEMALILMVPEDMKFMGTHLSMQQPTEEPQ